MNKSFFLRPNNHINLMLSKMGNPQNNYKIIQVTGTNGKGSVSSMIYSCLLEAGYRVGLYTKPTLINKCEKIRVGREYIKEEELPCRENDILGIYITALKYFSVKGCEYVVIENEVGALTDYTNTLNPYMSIITNVDYDHQDILGNTLEEITYNKCGLYKPSVIYPIVGDIPQSCMHVVKDVCTENGLNPIYAMEYQGNIYKSAFLGDFQRKNEKIVCCACNVLGIEEKYIELGLKNVKENSGLRGRWEIINEKPKVIVDVGHNMNAWEYHIKFLEEEVSKGKKVGVVFTMMLDRPIEEIFSKIPNGVVVYICTVDGTKLPTVNRLVSIADKVGVEYKSCFNGACNALETAITDGCDTILCSGSFFLCGEILKKWNGNV